MQTVQCITTDSERNDTLLLKRPYNIEEMSGAWHFQTDPGDRGEEGSWFVPGSIREREIIVPSPWQFIFDDMQEYVGTAWYERDFSLSLEYAGKRIVLVFESVDYECKVWVNGKPAGTHVGGYSAFELDVTKLVSFGDVNTVTVKVTDYEYVDFNENNHWNFHISGIWRRVFLQATGEVYIHDIWIRPDIDGQCAMIESKVFTPASFSGDCKLEIDVECPDGSRHKAVDMFSTHGGSDAYITVPVNVSIPDPVLWDLDKPDLHFVHVSIFKDGMIVDSASNYFGMRKISTEGCRIMLNNKPVYLFGGLDLCPSGANSGPAYRYPTKADLNKEVSVIKEVGLNYIRKHSCIEDPRYIYQCDSAGLLLQLAPPTIQFVNKEQKERWLYEWKHMIERDRSHPSVIIYTPCNENFGFNYNDDWSTASGKECAEFLAMANEIALEMDPDKLVITDSGGVSSGLHGGGTAIDDHPYYDLFEYEEFKNHVSKHKNHEIPTLITEMGSIVQAPQIDRFKNEWGEVPWFLETPTRNWDKSKYDHICVFPQGTEKRFNDWGIDKVFGDFETLAKKCGLFMGTSNKYQVEQIRKNKFISGHAFTDAIDDYGCHHGLINYWREKGFWADMFTKMLVGDLLILDWEQLNFFTNGTFRAEMYLSHMCREPVRSGTVRWVVEGTEIGGEIRNINVGEDFDVLFIAPICFEVPDVEISEEKGKEFHIIAWFYDDGRLVSKNDWEIYVYPGQWSKPSLTITINCPVWQGYGIAGSEVPQWAKSMGWEHSSLLYTMGIEGYEMHDGLDPENPVAVVRTIDDEVEKYIKKGGTAVLLAPDEFSCDILSKNGLKVARMGGGGPGKINFIRKESGIGKRIPYENPLLWPFYKAAPRVGLVGIDPQNNDDVIAGFFGHFINFQELEDATSYGVGGSLVKLRYGSGRILVSTFRIDPRNNKDPVAKIMLHDIIAFALCGFEAKTELK